MNFLIKIIYAKYVAIFVFLYWIPSLIQDKRQRLDIGHYICIVGYSQNKIIIKIKKRNKMNALNFTSREKISKNMMNGWNNHKKINEDVNLFISYLSSRKDKNGMPTRSSMIKEAINYANDINIDMSNKNWDAIIDEAKKLLIIITHNRDMIIITEKAKNFIANKKPRLMKV